MVPPPDLLLVRNFGAQFPTYFGYTEERKKVKQCLMTTINNNLERKVKKSWRQL